MLVDVPDAEGEFHLTQLGRKAVMLLYYDARFPVEQAALRELRVDLELLRQHAPRQGILELDEVLPQAWEPLRVRQAVIQNPDLRRERAMFPDEPVDELLNRADLRFDVDYVARAETVPFIAFAATPARMAAG